ncbi:heme exporter protein CcmD [Prosthecomicrobium pneumaticum]|uniref:Heme exporter protein D n=1 Tax=Prosthecomicrobium pneumaticum TaxID=81895 RepID=A0A7W9L2S1_9HYPH|nr:heme exporter protein CcmD [Prosthecomicrobium pneumaticum]MBB5753771.1 heme exporter protein D [Prosthecomicrobium pneumaticum]
MDLGPHAGFIIGAYLVTAAVVAGLVAWLLVDRARLSAQLKRLEKAQKR